MEFVELDELYAHLDSNAADYRYDLDMANLFQKIRDLKLQSGKVDEAEKAQWEMDCFNFSLQKGELGSLFSGTDGKGQPVEYPAISKFSDKALDYVAERLASASNHILKARYAHVLWVSPRKHAQYAKQAVDSYLELVKVYEEKDKKDPGEHYGLDVLDSVQTTSFIGLSINYRIDDILSEMERLIREFNFQSSSAFVMRARLISHMLEGKAKISPESYKEFSQICYDLGAKFFKDGDFHRAIDLFQVGEKVDNKLGSQTHDWNRSIAESYEGLMNQRPESDLAAIHFCQNAMGYYRKLKDEKKVAELEKKYEELRGKQQFQKFTQEIDLTEYGKRCREIAEKLCAEEPEKIISVLINDKGLLPKLKDMEARAEEIAQKTVLSSIVPVSITDRRGHTAEYFSTDDERKYYQILEQYALEINLAKQFLVNEIFVKAVKTDKLNIQMVIDCFERRSWFGKNIRKGIPGGEIVTYNWLNMISPGLNEYFNQMKAHFLKPAYEPNFVLAMDSLTLKIEGLIRDICSLSGVTTFYLAKDKQGRSIVREKDINWLLREEAIKKLFDEDDLLFFKFVLVEKAGPNLRHKIAHCLIDYSEYNITYMHLLLLVLFRLGRYDFVKPEETIEEKVADSE